MHIPDISRSIKFYLLPNTHSVYHEAYRCLAVRSFPLFPDTVKGLLGKSRIAGRSSQPASARSYCWKTDNPSHELVSFCGTVVQVQCKLLNLHTAWSTSTRIDDKMFASSSCKFANFDCICCALSLGTSCSFFSLWTMSFTDANLVFKFTAFFWSRLFSFSSLAIRWWASVRSILWSLQYVWLVFVGWILLDGSVVTEDRPSAGCFFLFFVVGWSPNSRQVFFL